MKGIGIITDGNGTRLGVVCHNLDDNSKFGHIGKMYEFDDVKAVIKLDCYDEEDIHYFAKHPKKIAAGTEVTLNAYWINFFGSYYRIDYNGQTYDIKKENVLFKTENKNNGINPFSLVKTVD